MKHTIPTVIALSLLGALFLTGISFLNDAFAQAPTRPLGALDASSPAAAQPFASAWQLDCVDCPKWVEAVGERSLQLDAEGHPHLAYGGDHLYYAWHDGTDWHYETVDKTPGAGTNASLALDSAGRPHISYYDATHQELKYARRSGQAWNVQTVDRARPESNLSSARPMSRRISLVLDASDQPHISYYDQDRLKYAHQAGVAWDIQTISQQAYFVSMVLDTTDHPHLSYAEGGAFLRTTQYAHWTGSAWVTQTVISADGGYYSAPSLVLDTSSQPHIAYCGNKYYGTIVRYARWISDTWDIQTVEGGDFPPFCGDLSLALDASGRPHISYRYDDSLKYARWMGNAWDVQRVDGPDDRPSSVISTLALGEDGYPRIAYLHTVQDNAVREMKYASWAGNAWNIQLVDNGGGAAGKYTSLALDSLGNLHISYQDPVSLDLKYARRTGSTWDTQTVDSEGDAGYSSSLALDALGHPHIAYYFQLIIRDPPALMRKLKYAYWTGSTWSIQVVDDIGDLTSELSLALDAYSAPHIAYYGGAGLKYARRTGTTWDIQDVGYGVPQQVSLALDAYGQAHLVYPRNQSYKINSCSLIYAHWTTSTAAWDSQNVYSGGCYNDYTSPSLVLDGLGRPNIAYYDGRRTKYIYWTGETWDGQTITRGSGTDISLALDAAGQPQVGYYDPSDKSLKYARRVGNAWAVQTVDNTGDVGAFASLALDAAGQPHLSYYDAAALDLKHAELALSMEARAEPVEVHNRQVVTYSLVISGAGSTVQLWNPLPDVLEYVSATLDSTLAPPATYSPTARAISWQGSLPINTVGVLRFQLTPQLTWKGLGPLASSVANMTWLTDIASGASLSASASLAVLPPGRWYTTTVGGMETGWYTSLALDRAGAPHIGYYDKVNDQLKYAWYSQSGWQVETVAGGGSSYQAMALVLDSMERPHLGYYDQTNSAIKYAWRTEAGWRVETLPTDNGEWTYSGVALALDSLDRPHLSFAQRGIGGERSVGYAWRDGTSWHVETVDALNQDPSLALDEAGRPHIIYQVYSAGYSAGLKYAWRDAAGWHIEMVDSSGGTCNKASLVLDEAGHPHISYCKIRPYCYQAFNLMCNLVYDDESRYAWRDQTSWHIESVPAGDTGYHASLALDEAGQPHIAYNALNYAWRDGSGWHTRAALGSYGQVGSSPSLALDKWGQPRLSYYNTILGRIEYAWWDSELFLDMRAEPAEVHNHHVVTYSLVLPDTDLEVRLWDPLPDALQYITGSISTTLTPPAVYSPTAKAITWQGRLAAGTLQVIQFQLVANITDTRSTPWPRPVTNTAWLVDLENGRQAPTAATINVIPPPLSLSKRVAPADGVRNKDILTYTLTLSGDGQNAVLEDPLPAGIYYVSGSLTSTISPLAVYSPTLKAVIWQGVLPTDAVGSMPTDTLGLIRFQATRGITTEGSLNLSLPIVNTAWLSDIEYGTCVSASAIANGYYHYLPIVIGRYPISGN